MAASEDGGHNDRRRKTLLAIRQSPHRAALRHVFLAERKARLPPALATTRPVDVRRCVVVGGGTMGAGIAYALARSGRSVVIVETGPGAVERAAANTNRIIETAIERERLATPEAGAVRDRLRIQIGYADLEQADLAIETATETMPVKAAIFAALEAAMPPCAVLATNTSSLDIDAIAASLHAPERLVGLHFFSPAHIMTLVEIVGATRTSSVALATAFAVAAALKKVPIRVGICDGFIGNRILARGREVADMLLMDGATPWDIDEAMVDFGYAMGPYEAQDLSGLDICYAHRKRLAPTRDPARRYVPIADRMVAEGRLGKKVGVGWYRYPGGGGAVVDPILEDLIAEESYFAKVERRAFTHDAITRRLLAAMILEAADILAEGIAARESDVDLVSILGCGFPRWRGGLMHYARSIGFRVILADVEAFAKDDPIVWRPGPGLLGLAGKYTRQ